MPALVNPKEFGLPARTVIENLDDATLALVIDRKSRIIMTDGRNILDKAKKISKVRPNVHIVVKTTAPVCSKTAKFLAEHNITVT